MYITSRVVIEGRTYQPGEYKSVANNVAPAVDEVTERAQALLLANFPGAAHAKKPAAPKPKAKRGKK